MFKQIIILAVISLLAACGSGDNGGQPSSNAIVGDSIIAGWASLPDEWQNYGVTGNRSQDVINRLDDVILARPVTIIIAIGVNDISDDVLLNRSDSPLFSNYAIILERLLKETSAKIYIWSILPTSDPRGTDPIIKANDRLRELSDIYNVTYVDTYSAFPPAADKTYFVDGIHPTPYGYTILNRFLPTITP
jgi:lysophospholipase L1-like esterase